MKTISLFVVALLAALSGPALAQGTAAPAAEASDATV